MRPIYKEEAEHFGAIKLDDYKFNFGVYFTNKKDEPVPIPDSVGRIVQMRKKGRDPVKGTTSAAIPCTDSFKNVNIELPTHA